MRSKLFSEQPMSMLECGSVLFRSNISIIELKQCLHEVKSYLISTLQVRVCAVKEWVSFSPVWKQHFNNRPGEKIVDEVLTSSVCFHSDVVGRVVLGCVCECLCWVCWSFA